MKIKILRRPFSTIYERVIRSFWELFIVVSRVNGCVIISQIWKRVESHHKERNLRCCSSNLNYTVFSFRLRWLCIYHHLIMLSQIPRWKKWKRFKINWYDHDLYNSLVRDWYQLFFHPFLRFGRNVGEKKDLHIENFFFTHFYV